MAKFGVDPVLASSRTPKYAAVLRAVSPKICHILTSPMLVVAFLLLMLTACAPDFEPREKVAGVDAETGQVIPPYPCPDWSQNATVNYDNSLHSNYGCAVNNNLAVQLANPSDLRHGRGSAVGNTDMGIRTIERYRAGELPATLTPMQAGTLSQ